MSLEEEPLAYIEPAKLGYIAVHHRALSTHIRIPVQLILTVK